MSIAFKKYLFLFLFMVIIFSAASSASLKISEIMYAPTTELGGSTNEWVELYNSQPDSFNLSSCLFYGNELGAGWAEGPSFIIIARDVLKFKEIYGENFLIFKNSFNRGLSNSGEELILNCTNSEIKLTYNPALGAENNGLTLCVFNGVWQECLATPGQENALNQNQPDSDLPPEAPVISENIFLSVYLDKFIYLNDNYNNLFKITIENKDNCSQKDNVTVFYNLTKLGSAVNELVKTGNFTKEIGCSSYASTGEVNPMAAGTYLLCGQITNSTLFEINLIDNQACQEFEVIDTSTVPCNITLQIVRKGDLILDNGQPLSFSPSLNNDSFPFVIEYWIEDLFGNLVKNKINTTNTNQKSWKTSIDEKDKVLFIKSRVYPFCQDENETNNFAENMFIVVKKEILLASASENSSKSSIAITKINPAEASFGDLIQVDLEIYKGSTSKYSVAIWVEKEGKTLSEKTKINLKNDQLIYNLNLPVQIDPNCERKIKDGSALLIVEGLGERAEKSFTLSGINPDLCAEIGGVTETEEALLFYKFVGLPTTITAGDILKLKVELHNDNTNHQFKAWSYLYRGSKCYSCANGEEEREANLISFDLDKSETKIIELPIEIDEIAAGEYSLTVKLNKDNQKTDKSLTQKIYVNTNKETLPANNPDSSEILLLKTSEKSLASLSAEKDLKKELLPELKGIVIYEDNSEKAKELIPLVLMLVFGLLSLALVWKKG